jgi:protein-disulfide isomerase-like protein with CxxC motif
MEPAWRKLRYHYGAQLELRHMYGGLLPGWAGFRDAGAGIGSPADVAPHWAEVASHYGQPIDPSVWLRDPLASSFPPSIAAHAVRLLVPEQEEAFLRRIREALFLEARNIARPELLTTYAGELGIDVEQFTTLYTRGIAEQAFRRELAEVRRLGVRGFPTLIISGSDRQPVVLHGSQNYKRLEETVLRVTGIPRAQRAPRPEEALAAYGSGTTLEFAELLDVSRGEVGELLTANGATRFEVAGDTLWLAPTAQLDLPKQLSASIV